MRIIFLLLFLGFHIAVDAQELNFNVKVTPSAALSKADPKIFKSLERSITEFINNNKWTDDEFEDEEKIQGNIQITIVEDPSSTSFVADVLIQSIRPVFGSEYSTQLLNFLDKQISFNYIELQPLETNTNEYKDNLSSVLVFYVHYILGLDYDSFSPFGGEEYFQIAQNISTAIPLGVSDAGWGTGKDGNRTDMIETMLNPRSRKLREASYNYHREGLDASAGDIGKAKAAMLSAIKDVQAVNASTPNSLSVQMFMDSKRKEIVDVFLQSDRNQLSKLYDILVEIDPSQSYLYSQLRSR